MLALTATGPISGALRYKLKWGDDPAVKDFYTTILSTSSVVGISFGSLYGGDFIKKGRKSTIINFNIIGIVGSILSLILNFKVMCVGRFLFGVSAGVLLCATPKILDETIPPHLIDKGFGASTNIMM